MKKLVYAACLVAALAISATMAQAQTDPIIATNRNDPSCTATPGITDLTTDSTSIDYATWDGTFNFVNCTGSDMYSLDLTFTDVPSGTTFTCFTDIWANCSENATVTSPTTITETFTMNDLNPEPGGSPYDPTSPVLCYASETPGSMCTGFLEGDDNGPGDTPEGDGATTTATPFTFETPEPSSMILFGSGLILLFVGTKRRFYARNRN